MSCNSSKDTGCVDCQQFVYLPQYVSYNDSLSVNTHAGEETSPLVYYLLSTTTTLNIGYSLLCPDSICQTEKKYINNYHYRHQIHFTLTSLNSYSPYTIALKGCRYTEQWQQRFSWANWHLSKAKSAAALHSIKPPILSFPY